MRKRRLTIIAMGLCFALAGCGNASDSNGFAASNVQTETDSGSQTDEGSSDAAESGSAASSEAADMSNVGTGEKYTNDEADGHAISASGETVSYDNVEVTKTGDSSGGDEADFYGTNAAVYAENGATLNITNAKITTDGTHENAVFSYGEGTTVNISDSVIDTQQNNSGGIMVTGGGTLNANNLTVTTQSGSSAAIRSDRGGGTMNVDGGTYKSYGEGSPAIYSTADITVKNATLYSDISQAVVVEGKNSVTLENVDATGQNTYKNSDKSDKFQAVMIYQSMSGDADSGNGKFTMKGGSLTSLNGGMFFVTNTAADIILEDVELNYATDDLLRIEKAGWGNDGENGGQVNFTAVSQELEGIITVDDISKLNLYLTDNSSFEGSIQSEGECYVEIEDGSAWVLTGDSSITSLTCSAGAIDLNGYTLTVNGEEYDADTASTGETVEFDYPEGDQQGNPPDGNGQGGPGGNAPDGNMAPPDGNGQGAPDGNAPDGSMTPPDDNGQGGPGGNPPDGSNPPGGDNSGNGNGNPPAKPE